MSVTVTHATGLSSYVVATGTATVPTTSDTVTGWLSGQRTEEKPGWNIGDRTLSVLASDMTQAPEPDARVVIDAAPWQVVMTHRGAFGGHHKIQLRRSV